MSELRIRGLQKSFDGHPVLHGIDLSVERGTLLALLGPSGSGKPNTMLSATERCGNSAPSCGT
jgi:iron(III) transport system ATP-binding protein